MQKTFCDRCGRDTQKAWDTASTIKITKGYGEEKYFDLCDSCFDQIAKFLNGTNKGDSK